MAQIRKGLVQTPTAQQTYNANPTSRPTDVQPHTVIGRQVPKREQPRQEPQREPERSRIIAHPNPNVPQPVRGLIVGNDGRPIRGLSQATMDAYKAHNEEATELCTRCGKMRPPAQMKTVVANAERSSNPVRICAVECIPVTYKDPYTGKEKWQPQVPAIRFNDDGKWYDARAAGISIADLVNRDTYHNENGSDIKPEQRALAPANEGQWSGARGERVGHEPRLRRA